MQIGDVRIINGRLSLVTSGKPYPCNFWYWRTIKKDGTLGKEYSGYNNGSQTMSKPISHTVIIQVEENAVTK